MKNLLNKIGIVEHSLYFDEEDLTRVIKVIDEVNSQSNLFILMCVNKFSIGNCGWSDLNKWFVRFKSTKKKWSQIRRELNVIRVWSLDEIPEDTIGRVYSND